MHSFRGLFHALSHKKFVHIFICWTIQSLFNYVFNCAVTMLITMSVQGSRLHFRILWRAWFTLHHSLDWMVCVYFSLHGMIDV